LIITEDGKSYPLLHKYEKDKTLKDLGITRYSKLKYKVIRVLAKDIEAALKGEK
jgi:hypothetical protein